MIRKIIALIWLRIQVLTSNKVMLSQVLMPVAMLLLYNSFLNKDGQASHYILYSLLTMAFGMSSGMLVSSTIAEETEKKIFKTLLLSGVNNVVYLLSVIFFPVLIAGANIAIFPKIVDVDFGKQTMAYLVITGITALCVILVYLAIGSWVKTQSQVQTYGIIPMLLLSFLPMMATSSEKITTAMNYTFLGLYSDFFNDSSFKLTFSTMKISLIWVAVLTIICIIVLNKKVKSN